MNLVVGVARPPVTKPVGKVGGTKKPVVSLNECGILHFGSLQHNASLGLGTRVHSGGRDSKLGHLKYMQYMY